METRIAIFRQKEIRKAIHKNEWWFSVIDVIEALTGTDRPRKYWSDLKKKLILEGYDEVSENIGQLKMKAPDGKMRETDCANTETMFRIVQSIRQGSARARIKNRSISLLLEKTFSRVRSKKENCRKIKENNTPCYPNPALLRRTLRGSLSAT
jgi:hypothetical protein